jgi:polyisoprenoid-binding protein YceI
VLNELNDFDHPLTAAFGGEIFLFQTLNSTQRRFLIMRSFLSKAAVGVLVSIGLGTAAAADEYTIDAAHSSVSFKIKHMGLSYVHGRFNAFSGGFSVDSADPTKTSFKMSIKSQSVDTNNQGRDGHLRGPDFFNAKQYASIDFKSSSVKPVKGGYEVTGDLTLHGETKPITFTLEGGEIMKDPRSGQRTGFFGDFKINRNDFGVGKNMQMLGEDVHISIGFEGTKKK